MTHLLFSLMAPTPGSGVPGWLLPAQILGFIAIFYFLLIRPQGQARKKHEELLKGLKKGDEVMTAGGLVGRVKDIKEHKEPAEVRVTLETGSASVVVERSRIVRVGTVSAPESAR